MYPSTFHLEITMVFSIKSSSGFYFPAGYTRAIHLEYTLCIIPTNHLSSGFSLYDSQYVFYTVNQQQFDYHFVYQFAAISNQFLHWLLLSQCHICFALHFCIDIASWSLEPRGRLITTSFYIRFIAWLLTWFSGGHPPLMDDILYLHSL